MIFCKTILWSKEEKRLRTVWRLGLHTVLVFMLTGLFTITLLFFAVTVDVFSELNLSDVILGRDVIALLHNSWVRSIIIPGATFLATYLTTYICGRWIDRREFTAFGFRLSRDWWTDLFFGFILGALLMGLIFLFGWATGTVKVSGFFHSFTEKSKFLIGFFQAVFFFLFVGFYEELLSRGYHLINLAEGFHEINIGRRWSVAFSLVVSSIFFGLLHRTNPYASWVSTLNVSLAGIFLGLGMVLTGRIALPIGLHISWNLFQGNVFGFPVSGTSTGATLIATESVGPEWLTGGGFGPEAGVLGLLAMFIGSVLIVLWVRRKDTLEMKKDLAVYQPLEKKPEGK